MKKTPFQERRNKRNKLIYEQYNMLACQGYGTMAACDKLASKFKLSCSTVYTIVRSMSVVADEWIAPAKIRRAD